MTDQRMRRQGQNPLEDVVAALTEEIVSSVQRLPEAKVPFGHVRLSPAEQLRRYVEMRDDTDAWRDRLRLLGPAEVMEYAERMERMLARYRDPFAALEDHNGTT